MSRLCSRIEFSVPNGSVRQARGTDELSSWAGVTNVEEDRTLENTGLRSGNRRNGAGEAH